MSHKTREKEGCKGGWFNRQSKLVKALALAVVWIPSLVWAMIDIHKEMWQEAKELLNEPRTKAKG